MVAGVDEQRDHGDDPGPVAHGGVDGVTDRRFADLEERRSDGAARLVGHGVAQSGVVRGGPGVAAAVGDQQGHGIRAVIGFGSGHRATVRSVVVVDNGDMAGRPGDGRDRAGDRAADRAGGRGPGDPDLPEVGVGPHPIPWPDDDRLDPQLLAEGDRRNVVDRYRYWSVEAIVADLDTRRHDFHVAIENWRHDLNIGTVVRNANAFGAAGVHIVGRRRWNRRGAMVTDRYVHVQHHATVGELAQRCRALDLVVVGIDNLGDDHPVGSRPLDDEPLPRRSLLLFGQEGAGLSAEAVGICDQVREIPMFGSTRSINAGVASGIAMHAWVRAHGP